MSRLKYHNAMVVFEELPSEITLAINITNCPCKCKECHSKFLWGDTGTELTAEELDRLIDKNDGVTAVCFMGGDRFPSDIDSLASYVHEKRRLRTGWYSGMPTVSDEIDIRNFDYVKYGQYDGKYGSLDKRTTNQRMLKVVHDGEMHRTVDITSSFWKKG